VVEFLRENNYDAHPNPRKGEIEKYFLLSTKTVVVRPSVSEEPNDGHFASMEKILVDLFVEKEKLYLMDGSEYSRIFKDLAFRYRINMAPMLRYADRRKVKAAFISQMLSKSANAIQV